MTWPFPFVEDRLFILTLRAGVEGYHVNIGGRHVSSFPYRTVLLLCYLSKHALVRGISTVGCQAQDAYT